MKELFVYDRGVLETALVNVVIVTICSTTIGARSSYPRMTEGNLYAWVLRLSGSTRFAFNFRVCRVLDHSILLCRVLKLHKR